MNLTAKITNKTMGITKGKMYKVWVVYDNRIFLVDENDNGDTVLVYKDIFDQEEGD